MPTNLLNAFTPPPPQGTEQQPQQNDNALLGAFSNTNMPTSGEQPSAIPTPETWDFKTAQFGLNGEKLPEGAEGWTPYGQPFFGGGIKGKFKEYAWMMTKDIKHSSSEDWQQIRDQFKGINERQKELTASGGMYGSEENAAAQGELSKEALGAVGSAIGTWWKDLEANKETPLGQASRAVGVGVQAIGDAFSLPAIGLERGLSAVAGAIEGIQQVTGPTPRLDENTFTEGMAINPTNMVADPDKNRPSSLEQIWESTKAGWNAGRIFYASTFDNALREEYIRRYQAGEDADLLGMELANRNVNVFGHEVNGNIVEMLGQLALDPLNFIGALGKVKNLEKAIDKASDIGGIYRDASAMDALKVLNEGAEDAKTMQAWDTIVQAQVKAVDAVENNKIFKMSWSPTALTVSSREDAVLAVASDWLGTQVGGMLREGYSREEFLEALKAGVKSVAKDATEMQEGISGIAKMPNAPRWFGDDAIATYKTIRNFLSDEEGVLSFKKLDDLFAKSNDFAGFTQEASKLLGEAAKQFPTINEMEAAANVMKDAAKTGASVSQKTKDLAEMYDHAPSYAKLLNKVNNSKIGQVRNAINGMLGKFYFNYQGGVAAKNMLSNNVMIAIDDGLKAFAGTEEILTDAGKVVTRPKIWSNQAVADNMAGWFGDFKPSGVAGFESSVKAGTGADGTTIFSKATEWGEQTGAMRVFDNSVRDSMKKLLKIDNLGDVKTLRAAGMSEPDVKFLEKLYYLEKGNTQKIMETFRAYKGGKAGEETVEAWRTLDFLSKRDVEILDGQGILDDLHDLTKNAQTPEDVEAAFAKWKQQIGEYAQEAGKDVAGMSENNPALTSFGLLSDAENSGLLDKGASAVFSAITEAGYTAEAEYTSMLQQTVDQLINGRMVDQKAGSELLSEKYRLFDPKSGVIANSGRNTKQVSDALVKNAWHYTDNFAQELKQVGGDLAKLWKKIGLEGQPPTDLTKRSLLQEVWKVTKEQQASAWNAHFDRAFSESQKLKQSIGKYMDSTALESQFSQSEWAVKKAQEYRQVVFDNGALKIKPMDNILWMAKEYGIPSATEAGVPLDKNLLNIINKTSDELSPYVSRRISEEAKRLSGELSSGGVEKSDIGAIMGSSNVEWYKESGKSKSALDKALQKIISGEGRKSSNVDAMREQVLSNITYGDAASGTPPDLYVLQQLGADNTTMQKALDAFNDITGQDLDIKAAIKASAPAGGDTGKYARLEDVPPQQALQAFEKWRIENGRPEVKLSGFSVPPPHPDGSLPSFGRSWLENQNGTNHLLDRVKNAINQQWGRRVDSALTPELESALQNFVRNSGERVDEAKSIAVKVGTEARNFTMLNYGQRTYADIAAAWVMPYHFFYTRSYGNWIKRLATSPEVIAGYSKYRTAMERVHYDMPDFFKNNIDVSKPLEFLGIKTEHPLYLNLEAAINPLNGLTGTDFNDPAKRTDWFSNTLDDIGKFGPSVWAPLNIANALRLSLQGEADAAARWAGRLIPETKQINEVWTALTGKTSSNFLGMNISHELDPAVQLFSGGMDPFERNRVGRALGALIGFPDANGNIITKEQALEAARTQSGPLWEQARVNSNNLRSGTMGINSITSYLFGVGFKGRTQEDVQIDQMMGEMGKLQALSQGGGLTAEQYRAEWEKMAEKYPFMETILLARRGGDERDGAYAYNALSRIPPGDSTQLFKDIGLSAELVQKFYDSKGDFSSWSEGDRSRFMAAMIDIGATYAMPDNATRGEWASVRTTYYNAQEQISQELGMPYTRENGKITGKGIWDLISTYYDMRDTNEQKAVDFKQAHPEIDVAFGMLNEIKMSDPQLAKYYASLNMIESYYFGRTRSDLAKKYGKDITDKQSQYFALGVENPAAAKQFLKQHPELKQYWADKRTLDEQANAQILAMAANLPTTAQGAQLRSDFAGAENATQQALVDSAQGQQVTWQDVSANMSTPLQNKIMAYVQGGARLSNAALKELEYLAKTSGGKYYNADDLLRQAVVSLQTQNAQGGMQNSQQPAFSGQPLANSFAP